MEKSNNLNVVICSVGFAEVSMINYTTLSQDKCSRTVSLMQNQAFEDVYFTPGTAEVSNDNQTVAAGYVFSNSLVVKYPGDGSTTPAELKKIQNKRGIVHYIYSNGTVKTFGTQENPAVCSCSFSSVSSSWTISFTQRDSLPGVLMINA